MVGNIIVRKGEKNLKLTQDKKCHLLALKLAAAEPANPKSLISKFNQRDLKPWLKALEEKVSWLNLSALVHKVKHAPKKNIKAFLLNIKVFFKKNTQIERSDFGIDVFFLPHLPFSQLVN